MRNRSVRVRRWGVGGVLTAAVAAAAAVFMVPGTGSPTQGQSVPEPPPATPVSVAIVEQRDIALWDEFSGRLEAIERVDVRARVAGQVQTVHFREGALVRQGDLLITIDPAPYAAEVRRAEAQVAAAQAELVLARSELDRSRQLWERRVVPQRDLDERLNAERGAEANLRAAEAGLEVARLNLGYTSVRAPVAGRVGRLEVTVGNLVAAGPGAPVLTTLVSIDPIYASFSADEETVARVLGSLGAEPHGQLGRIPVRMDTATSDGTSYEGALQLVDNQVDGSSGTVFARAVFANPDGLLIPGQFARLQVGRATTEPAVLVSERAVGTDQDKKFVTVVGQDDKAEYREVTLGPSVDGLRVVTQGVAPGERVVVNGLQRVRPGTLVAPQLVPMLAEASLSVARDG
jgi:membrane fusion protein, multidrug efflux system